MSSQPYVLAVLAGKGGVGKSWVALTLARAAQAQGLRVGLLDADVYGPSAHLLAPPETQPQIEEGRVLPARSRGLALMSVAFLKGWSDLAAVRAPIANALIQQFAQEVDWGPIDLLVVDVPPGTGDITITLTQTLQIDAAVLVSTPQATTTSDVRKAAAQMRQVAVPLKGLVENFTHLALPGGSYLEPFGPSTAPMLLEEWGFPSFLSLPLEPTWSAMARRGEDLFQSGYAHSMQPVVLRFLQEVLTPASSQVSAQITAIEADPTGRFLLFCLDHSKWSKIDVLQLVDHCPCCACRAGLPVPGRSAHRPPRIRTVTRVGAYGFTLSMEGACSRGIYPVSWLHDVHAGSKPSSEGSAASSMLASPLAHPPHSAAMQPG